MGEVAGMGQRASIGNGNQFDYCFGEHTSFDTRSHAHLN
jgi:hypothetical protein